ncbi:MULTISPECIES: hypothetical protein [unclassified Streptomyces]|nr:hypothetical protein [Streptomyces sp. AC558_RSS880]
MSITPDPAIPEGAAVIELAELLDDLQERTGEWPGADIKEWAVHHSCRS